MTDPAPFEDWQPGQLDPVYDEFPSCRWGVDEWLVVFEAAPVAMHRMLDGIAKVSRTWLDASPKERRLMARPDVYDDNTRLDETMGL